MVAGITGRLSGAGSPAFPPFRGCHDACRPGAWPAWPVSAGLPVPRWPCRPLRNVPAACHPPRHWNSTTVSPPFAGALCKWPRVARW